MDSPPDRPAPLHRRQPVLGAVLFWCDHNLRFHAYDRMPPSTHIEEFLAEVDRDPT
jgi:hypothetical protein